MQLVYFMGLPGVGKSTLVTALTGHLVRIPQDKPVPHELLEHPVRAHLAAVEVGRSRISARGTDALSMSIMPKAIDWIRNRPSRLVLAEGDRLASMRFFTAAQAAGYHVTLVHCHAEPALVEQRQPGKSRSASWLRGQATKVRNLLRSAGDARMTVIPLACDTNPATLVRCATRAIPCLEDLR